jgi:hypothetical protein
MSVQSSIQGLPYAAGQSKPQKAVNWSSKKTDLPALRIGDIRQQATVSGALREDKNGSNHQPICHPPLDPSTGRRNYNDKIQIVMEWWGLHRDSLLQIPADEDLDEDHINRMNLYLKDQLCPHAATHPDLKMADLIITVARLEVSNCIARAIWMKQGYEILTAYLQSRRLEKGQQLWEQLLLEKCAAYESIYGGYVDQALMSIIQQGIMDHQGCEAELAVNLQLLPSLAQLVTHTGVNEGTIVAPLTLHSQVESLSNSLVSSSAKLPIVTAFDATVPLIVPKFDDSLLRLAETYSQPWVKPIEFRGGSTLLIQAGLGRGKSLACKLLVQKSQYPRALAMSPRQTYAANLQGELNRAGEVQLDGSTTQLQNLDFTNYLDQMQDSHWARHNRLIISPESLHRLYTDYQPYDLVIIDESESVLKQFSSPTTMKDNISMCVEMCGLILKDAKHVVMLDAFLTKTRSYDVAKSLRGHLRLEINTHPQTPRQYRFYTDSDRLFEVFIEQLQQDWKIYFYCASKKKALALQAKVETLLPNNKGLVYTSETLGPDRRALQNVRELWGDPGLSYVITTSTNTVGINFDIKPKDPRRLRPFDLAFAYFSANGPVPRDGFQNLMRPRYLTQNFLHVYINNQYRGSRDADYGSTPNEVRIWIQRRETLIDRTVERLGIRMNWNTMPEWFQNLDVANRVEDGQSHRFQSQIVHRYLEECNYTPEEQGLDEQEGVDELGEVPSAPYDSIPEIDDPYAKLLNNSRKKGEITREGLQMLNKYFFQKKFEPNAPIERLKHLFVTHWQELEGKRWLYNLYDEKNYTPEEILQRDANRCGRLKNRCNAQAERRRLIGVLNITLGLSNSSIQAEISYELLISITPKIFDLRDDLRKAFELRITNDPKGRLSTHVIHLIKQIYQTWSGNRLSKKLEGGTRPRKKINGTKTDVSSYCLQGLSEKEYHNGIERYITGPGAVAEDCRLWNLIRERYSSNSLTQALRNLIPMDSV